MGWIGKGGHWGGYTYRLCKLPKEGKTGLTEECFAKYLSIPFIGTFISITPRRSSFQNIIPTQFSTLSHFLTITLYILTGMCWSLQMERPGGSLLGRIMSMTPGRRSFIAFLLLINNFLVTCQWCLVSCQWCLADGLIFFPFGHHFLADRSENMSVSHFRGYWQNH